MRDARDRFGNLDACVESPAKKPAGASPGPASGYGICVGVGVAFGICVAFAPAHMATTADSGSDFVTVTDFRLDSDSDSEGSHE